MRRATLLVLACLSVLAFAPRQAWATWTMTQHVISATCPTSNNPTCTVTVASTTAGDVGVIAYAADSGCTVGAITGGGTWSTCTGCSVDNSTVGYHLEARETLSLAGGATSLSLQINCTSNPWHFTFIELHTTLTPAFDVAANTGAENTGTNVSTEPGAALSLTGANDAIVQIAGQDWSDNVTAITSPYSSYADVGNPQAFATAINTSSGAAPTWTLASANNSFIGLALAFKETGGAPAKTCTLALMGAGPC